MSAPAEICNACSRPLSWFPSKRGIRLPERALRFALQLSPDVIAVHISADEGEAYRLRTQWEQYVEKPIAQAGLPQPRLILLLSPYRRLFTPLIQLHQST